MCKQGDQIGRFLKILGDKIYNKRSPKDCQLFGLFCNTSLLQNVKTVVVTFWALLETFWLLITPIYGHTAGKPVTPLYPKSSLLPFDHRLGPNILNCVFRSPGLKKRSDDNFYIFLLNEQSNKIRLLSLRLFFKQILFLS